MITKEHIANLLSDELGRENFISDEQVAILEESVENTFNIISTQETPYSDKGIIALALLHFETAKVAFETMVETALLKASVVTINYRGRSFLYRR